VLRGGAFAGDTLCVTQGEKLKFWKQSSDPHTATDYFVVVPSSLPFPKLQFSVCKMA
jgi:hypothetical protein